MLEMLTSPSVAAFEVPTLRPPLTRDAVGTWFGVENILSSHLWGGMGVGAAERAPCAGVSCVSCLGLACRFRFCSRARAPGSTLG